jgi:hypothetical protein
VVDTLGGMLAMESFVRLMSLAHVNDDKSEGAHETTRTCSAHVETSSL